MSTTAWALAGGLVATALWGLVAVALVHWSRAELRRAVRESRASRRRGEW